METKKGRKHERIESANLVSYGIVKDENQVLTRGMGKTLNVSEGGILIETHTQLNANDKIVIDIGLEDDLVQMDGEIIFSKPAEVEGRFEAGIKFTHFTSVNRRILNKFIETFLEQRSLLGTIGIDLKDLDE